MKQVQVDNLIIGFGKAGKTLAADLAKHGQQVWLVERSDEMYGGTCINIGCIPSKRLLVDAERVSPCPEKQASFTGMMQRKEVLVSGLRKANLEKLTSLDGVRVIHAEAKFEGPKTVSLMGEEGVLSVEAKRIFINTGSSPARLDVPGNDGPRIYDSTGCLSLTECPERLIIVGGGYISLEFATLYTYLGSKVTILEAGDTFLSREEREVADEMQRILTSRGVKIVLQAETRRFIDEGKYTRVETSQGSFEADAVLVAIGRRPNTAELNLEKTDIKLDGRGYIVTDDLLRAADSIWAMGDVAGTPQFTYMSLDDYRIVREQLLGEGLRRRTDRLTMPTTVFTQPPLSQVGLTEAQAQKEGRDIVVKKIPAMAVPKAKVLSQTDGFLKAVVDKQSGLILGATLFCAESHELINLIKMAIDNKISADYLKNQIFTHPTMGEALNDLFA